MKFAGFVLAQLWRLYERPEPSADISMPSTRLLKLLNYQLPTDISRPPEIPMGTTKRRRCGNERSVRLLIAVRFLWKQAVVSSLQIDARLLQIVAVIDYGNAGFDQSSFDLVGVFGSSCRSE